MDAMTPRELVVSTRNPGKLVEFRALLDAVSAAATTTVSPSTAADRGVPDVEETGTTFEANALLKAAAAFERTGAVCLADDSGLIVDALGGEPGVYSARFAGPAATSEDNNRLLLERLDGVPTHERSAAFVCNLVLILPDTVAIRTSEGSPWHVVDGPGVPPGAQAVSIRGRVEGRILEAPRGQGGFGYDPLFFYEPAGVSFAELDRREKNRVSHRGRALAGLRSCLEQALRPSD